MIGPLTNGWKISRSTWLGLALLAAGMALASFIGHFRTGLDVPIAGSVVLLIFLMVLSGIDLETRRLPNWLTLPLIGLGLVQNWALGNALLIFLIGGVFGYLMIYGLWLYSLKIRGKPGIGLGDAKLLAASGSWLGVYNLPAVLLIASSAGLIAALIGFNVKGEKLSRTTAIPFGPYISLGTWAVWCNSFV